MIRAMNHRVMRRLTTRLHRAALDGRIARGDAWEDDEQLASRAAELIELATRRRIADNLERAIADEGRPRYLSPAVPVHGSAVAVARPVLEQLIVALRCPGPVWPRGVAIVELLLTEAESPLYGAPEEETLVAEARHALDELFVPFEVDPRPRSVR
jgi:hypothetical protein